MPSQLHKPLSQTICSAKVARSKSGSEPLRRAQYPGTFVDVGVRRCHGQDAVVQKERSAIIFSESAAATMLWQANETVRTVFCMTGRHVMTARGDRTAVLARVRRTRCWKNRCNNTSPPASAGAGDIAQGRALQPAFRDTSTGVIYPSRFTDGRPAPLHVLDGLPNSAVLARSLDGRVASVKQTVEAGFSRGGRFYTREEAAAVCQHLHPKGPLVAAWQFGQRLLFCAVQAGKGPKECNEVPSVKSLSSVRRRCDRNEYLP